jgi:hypothetical protein
MTNELDTKFRDMSDGVRNRWVKWCFRHDWCVSAGQNASREFFVEDQNDETHKFETPRELRNWAGY